MPCARRGGNALFREPPAINHATANALRPDDDDGFHVGCSLLHTSLAAVSHPAIPQTARHPAKTTKPTLATPWAPATCWPEPPRRRAPLAPSLVSGSPRYPTTLPLILARYLTVVLLSRRHAIEPWTGWPFFESPPNFASIPGRKTPLFNSSPNPGTSPPPPPPRSHAPSQQTLREADVVVVGCTAHSCTHHTYSRIHAASAATLNIRRTPVSEANHHLYLLCIGRPSPLFPAYPGTAKRL
ncbi:hypothetical protein IWX50DRAFT_182802 [Phyllosticta citricarpa]